VNACPNLKRRSRTFAMACVCAPCTTARTASRRRAQTSSAGFQRACWGVEPDEIAVERALGGDRPAVLAAADRLEVVRIATARGESAAQIAARLRVSPRTVVRYRGRLAA
jgi:DNA-binding NarL/FixJ family response regulator